MVAGAAIVGGQRHVPQQGRRLGVRRIPEPEEGWRGKLGLQRHQRDDPDPSAHEQRPAAVVRSLEAAAQRAEQAQAVARAQLAQAPCARPDVLEQELQLAGGAAQVGEGPR